MKKISVAVVGSGVMGGIHAKIARQGGKAQIDYVVDADLKKAQEFAAQHQATALQSIQELAGKGSILPSSACPIIIMPGYRSSC